MAGRVIICITWLLALFSKVEVMRHKCSSHLQLANCTKNSRINITKTEEYYKLYLRIIPVCSDNQCIHVPDILDLEFAEDNMEWIECNNVCGYCESLMEQECGSNKTACEEMVDHFLNSYCKNITLALTTIIAPSQCSQTSIATLTTIVSPSCSQSSSSSLELTEKSTQTADALTALGTLLGFSVVLLAVVITGWVSTCLLLREKRQSPAQNSKVAIVNTKDEDRIFQNPTYEETSTTQPQTSIPIASPEQGNSLGTTSTYDTIQPPSQAVIKNGQTYDVLNRGQANGSHPSRDTGRPHMDKNYSKLGQLYDQ